MDVAAVCRRAAELCRVVAPIDLDGLALYVLAMSELPAGFARDDGLFGYTNPWLDLLLRDHLGARWTGRGAVLVLNDGFISRQYGDMAEAVLLAFTLHELTHALQVRRTVYDADLDAAAIDFGRAAIAANVHGDGAPAADDPAAAHQAADFIRCNFSMHDDAFVRGVMHLRHRAKERAGVDLALRFVLGWPPCRHHPFYYDRALAAAGDYAACAHLPVSVLLDRPAPQEFIDLCAADRERFDTVLSQLTATVDEGVTVNEIIMRLAAVFASRAADQQQTYQEAVAAVAAGKRTDLNHLADLLQEAGRTVEDFQRDVAALVQRHELQAKLARRAGLQAELDNMNAEYQRHEATLAEAQRHFDDVSAPLALRGQQLRHELFTLDGIEAQLAASAPAPARDAVDAVGRELGAISGRAAELAKAREKARDEAVMLRRGLVAAPDDVAATEAQVAHYDRIVREADAELAALDAQRADAERRLEAARAAMVAA